MTNRKLVSVWENEQQLSQRMRSLLGISPWVLRVTEHKDKPIPVLIIKERFIPEARKGAGDVGEKPRLKDRGLLYGQALRRCLPVIRRIVGRVCDHAGIPLELQRLFDQGRIAFRGNLPLDEEAGAKLALLFKLQEGIKDPDRVELIAWRVERFSREEAAYWLTRAIHYGDAANRWACAGMRIMLGGQPGDRAVRQMLDKLRD
ncbi:MAG: DUF7680 family protein [Bacillota bacterium]